MEKKMLHKIIEKAKKDKKIIAVALFGSSSKGKGRDIDICLFMDNKITDKEAIEKRIKLLGEFGDKFDITIFHQLPIYIRIRIIKEGKILFVRNENLLYDIALQTIQKFNDFKNMYESYIENALK